MVKKRSKGLFCLFWLLLFAGFIHAQELVLPLSSNWKFRKLGSSDEWLPATVPGTVHTDLLRNGKIEDPFLGTNNLNLGWIDETDWEYSLDFYVSESLLKNRHVELVFDGLDTYADVYLNGGLVLKADNMFRRWTIDCAERLTAGSNNITIIFKSALAEVKRKSKDLPYTLPGGEWAFVRKAPYHFGWDWGPRLITSGIWKPVYIQSWRDFTIKDIQVHTDSIYRGDAYLKTNILISSARFQHLKIKVSEGNQLIGRFNDRAGTSNRLISVSFKIKDAKLWWSNGMGESYMYKLNFQVEGENLSQAKAMNYGIRTVELVQEPDNIGKSFFFKVNGIPVFMKGANMIPRHSFIPSASKAELRKLLKSAASSGVNMLRIWGGGVYEDDLFYNLCDSLGILIWQDFMFAGSMYPGDSVFLDNVKGEITQQVLRIRNHPCIALWCGNNEVDEAWYNWGWQKQYNMSKADSTKIWTDYKNLFQKLIPDVIAEHDSERPYWASSPKNGWGRKQSMTEGDSHYWGVWWGFEPFSVYQTKVPRFMSEFGFQGFPDAKTVALFSRNGSEKPDSMELLAHQKHPVGYQTIDKYSQREGFYPKTLDDRIYISQIVQSIGYRTAIESHRLAMPKCMGTLYWQLNDCWPVVSWSSIDFYGHWKAVQYTVRDAYKPILLSTKASKSHIDINVVSDLRQPVDGVLNVSVYNLNGEVLKNWSNKVEVKPNKSESISHLAYQFADIDSANVFVNSEFISTSGEAFKSYAFNCKLGYLNTQNPEIKMRIEGRYLVLTCTKPAFYVNISSVNDIEVDNNFFNMLPGKEYKVKVFKGILNDIEVKTLFDYIHKN